MNISHKIQLSIVDRELVQGFLENRRDSTALYNRRGGFKDEDILAGALGEIAAARFLCSRGVASSEPDFTHHAKKSHNADLTDGNRYFHVKTQTSESEKRYGSSWIMQRHDPILKKAPYKHYLILCVIDLENLIVDIKGIISVNTIVRYGHVGECKAPQFRHSKVALYWTSICKLSRKALWGVVWKK